MQIRSFKPIRRFWANPLEGLPAMYVGRVTGSFLLPGASASY